MLKKFISTLLAVVIVVSTFTTMTVSATEESPASIANNNISMQGENSFGNLLTEELEGAVAQETTSDEFALTGLKIEGQTATVEYMSAIDCTILVALYDEATNKMVASGKSIVSSEEDVAEIAIEAEEMPKYFVATAYMLDSNNAPLTEEYTTELYTEEIQKVKAMKATDFEEDRVLKLEDTDETNFAVYSEDTKVLKYKENYNIPVTVDDENGIYVFSNCNDELKTLKKGDMLAYEYSLDNIIILKVDTIKIDGDTVTITEGDAELEDVFDYVKIEGSQGTSDCEVNMDGIDESVQLVDDASSVSSKNPSSVGAVEGDVTFTPEDLKVKLFGDATGKNIAVTGDIGFGAKATLEFYISFEKVCVDFDISYSLGCNITLTVKTKDKIRIPIVNISIIPVTGVVVSFTPTVVFEAQASITLSMGASGSFGFVSDENGVRTVCRPPETDTELKAKGEMFLGLQIKPQLSIVSKKIFAIGLPVTGGICVEAENRDAYKHKDEENGVKHLCHVCFEGNISAKISIEADVELFGKKIGSVGASLKKPLFSFYYSVDFNDVGKGDCPHNGSEVDSTEPTESTTPTDSTSPTSPTGDIDETKPYIIESGKCGDNVTWEYHKSGLLKISGEGDIKSYSFTNMPWNDYKSYITSVIISDGITTIGSAVFSDLEEVKEIKIPDSVTTIKASAFSSCNGLTEILIPESVTWIDQCAFNCCKGLKRIYVYGNPVICDGAFAQCMNVEDVYVYGNPTTYYQPFPKQTTVHYMNSNSVSASLASSGLIGSSNGSVAEFDNLIAGGDYIVAVVKSEETEDLISADNLLYIDQLTADEKGNVSLEYVPRESIENSVALIFGADKMSISDAEVTAIKDEGSQTVEYTVTLNGAVLTENIDYELAVDGEFVTVTGINKYKESVTLTVEPMLIGDVNQDNTIKINDTTLIMKYIAKIEIFDENQKLVADTNGDGVITITDATQVQKYLASIITSFK